jgi:hypothetical protein
MNHYATSAISLPQALLRKRFEDGKIANVTAETSLDDEIVMMEERFSKLLLAHHGPCAGGAAKHPAAQLQHPQRTVGHTAALQRGDEILVAVVDAFQELLRDRIWFEELLHGRAGVVVYNRSCDSYQLHFGSDRSP